MKTTSRLLAASAAFLAFSVIVAAQVTNAVSGASASTLPSNPTEYAVLAIAVLTPLIVGGVYKFVPNIPKVILPCLAPLIGILLGLVISWLSKMNLGWIDMAQAGALAVFVREVFNNAVTKQMATPDKPVVLPVDIKP